MNMKLISQTGKNYKSYLKRICKQATWREEINKREQTNA